MITSKFNVLQLQPLLTSLQVFTMNLLLKLTYSPCLEIDEYEKEHKIMIRYAKDLLSILMQLFEKAIATNNYILQEDVLNAISIIAVGLDSAFAEYYNSFMPGLKKLLVSIPGENEQQCKIRCLTIECIGHLVASIRQTPDLFINDVSEIFELLIAIQNSPKIAFDDPEQTSILNVFTFISDVLKDKFAPFLDRIFPRLADALKTDVAIVVQDVDNAKTGADGKSKNILKVIFPKRKQIISIHSKIIENLRPQAFWKEILCYQLRPIDVEDLSKWSDL